MSRTLRLLESYEQYAYSGGFGEDWLVDVGEGFKFFVQFCDNAGITPTIPRFMRWIETRIADKEHAEFAKKQSRRVSANEHK